LYFELLVKILKMFPLLHNFLGLPSFMQVILKILIQKDRHIINLSHTHTYMLEKMLFKLYDYKTGSRFKKRK